MRRMRMRTAVGKAKEEERMRRNAVDKAEEEERMWMVRAAEKAEEEGRMIRLKQDEVERLTDFGCGGVE